MLQAVVCVFMASLMLQAVVCVPKENQEMEIFSSSQGPTQLQMFVSSVMNIPSNKVNVRVKRVGQCLEGVCREKDKPTH